MQRLYSILDLYEKWDDQIVIIKVKTSNNIQIKYELNEESNLYDKLERRTEILWEILLRKLEIYDTLQDLYNNYINSYKITIIRWDGIQRYFLWKRYENYMNNTKNKQKLYICSLLENKGIPMDIALKIYKEIEKKNEII
jgi:hypothetical protein